MSKYLDIKYFDDANTDDYGVGIWFSHCPHHCKGCYNPSTWKQETGTLFTSDTMGNIFNHFEKYGDRYGNLFLTGGDPLSDVNIATSITLCKSFKEKFGDRFKVWVWTGFELRYIPSKEILKYIDVVIDGKFIEDRKDLELLYRGSSNQRIWKKNESGEFYDASELFEN